MDMQFWLTAIVAVAFSGLAKGGFAGVGMLATPLLSLVVPPLQAASIVLPILVAQDLVACVIYRKQVDWTILRPMLPGAVAGIAVGYLFAARVPEGILTITLGIISALFALRGLIRMWRKHDGRMAPHAGLAALAGAGAGVTSMISHAGAPPFQMYVLPLRLPRDTFVGCTVYFFCIVNLVKLPPFLLLGQYDTQVVHIVMILLPWAFVASLCGVWLVRRTDPVRFERIILILLGLVGLMLIRNGVAGLA
ncbi:sulfite exporter TauE/SafE family protein [Salipiger sp. P9]|uniref:sulfite exporter TauE/SafE family protein n=1 Tax=Salipiger pentaromativorans TaxID=2943193 RepID=UPI00215838A2|nr:sulfite exporter TauE/SafE family protein [Salipiger pentaromativorans]MCR8550600.1 sulfite exporter TauE/SafE family protein [Salipiger pentaromativorans]